MSNPTEAFLDHQTPEDLSRLTPWELESRCVTAEISIKAAKERLRLLREEVVARTLRGENFKEFTNE